VEDAGERDQDFLIGNPPTKAGVVRRAWELPPLRWRIGTAPAVHETPQDVIERRLSGAATE
jgi:hypothetical protein